jgi:biotin carboxyl carrier protein
MDCKINISSPVQGCLMSILVKVGDTVCKGQPVAEVEYQKIIFLVSAPSSGVVLDTLFQTGHVLTRNDTIATLKTED